MVLMLQIGISINQEMDSGHKKTAMRALTEYRDGCQGRRGEPGCQGKRGVQGPRGRQGVQGDTGKDATCVGMSFFYYSFSQYLNLFSFAFLASFEEMMKENDWMILNVVGDPSTELRMSGWMVNGDVVTMSSVTGGWNGPNVEVFDAKIIFDCDHAYLSFAEKDAVSGLYEGTECHLKLFMEDWELKDHLITGMCTKARPLGQVKGYFSS